MPKSERLRFAWNKATGNFLKFLEVKHGIMA
jgi:hypothetical protein